MELAIAILTEGNSQYYYGYYGECATGAVGITVHLMGQRSLVLSLKWEKAAA